MPFIDSNQGRNHHRNNECKKCKDCNAHYTGISILPVNLCRDCGLHLMEEVAVISNEDQMKTYKKSKD